MKKPFGQRRKQRSAYKKRNKGLPNAASNQTQFTVADVARWYGLPEATLRERRFAVVEQD